MTIVRKGQDQLTSATSGMQWFWSPPLADDFVMCDECSALHCSFEFLSCAAEAVLKVIKCKNAIIWPQKHEQRGKLAGYEDPESEHSRRAAGLQSEDDQSATTRHTPGEFSAPNIGHNGLIRIWVIGAQPASVQSYAQRKPRYFSSVRCKLLEFSKNTLTKTKQKGSLVSLQRWKKSVA